MDDTSVDDIPAIEVDDLLKSISDFVSRQREISKRSILADVESKIDASFDNFKLNVANFLRNAVCENETTTTNVDCGKTTSIQSTNRKRVSTNNQKANFNLIKIDEEDEVEVEEEEGADVTINVSSSLESEISINDFEQNLSFVNASGDSSLPGYIRNNYPFFVKDFVTFAAADQYRLHNNFWRSFERAFPNGKIVVYVCWNQLQCKAKLCVWKANKNERYKVFSNGVLHNHEPEAATRKIPETTKLEMKTLFNKGIRSQKEIFDFLCNKHGPDSVNGFHVVRYIRQLRKSLSLNANNTSVDSSGRSVDVSVGSRKCKSIRAK